MNRDPIDPNLPLGYRWATDDEDPHQTPLGMRSVPLLYVRQHHGWPDGVQWHMRARGEEAPMRNAILTDRNMKILRESLEIFDKREGPRVGDYVRFADDTDDMPLRRFSHDWDDTGIQTSDGYSWHMGDSGYMSHSGSLYRCVKRDTLTQADETRFGWTWFFDQGWARAHHAVDVQIPLRVFDCALTRKEAS